MCYGFLISGKPIEEIKHDLGYPDPKIDGSKENKDYRPISMVGCVYKVIAKVLANRIHSVMNELVGESQMAFVEGRQIHNGALIASEIVQWLKKRKKNAMTMKEGLHKAYDLVEWVFVDHVLEKNKV